MSVFKKHEITILKACNTGLLIFSIFMILNSNKSFANINCSKLKDSKIFSKTPSKVVPDILFEAGNKILKLRKRKDFNIKKKSNFADLKTKGDCASQNIIFRQLRKIYPKHKFSGEEKCYGENQKNKKTSGDEIVWLLDQ